MVSNLIVLTMLQIFPKHFYLIIQVSTYLKNSYITKTILRCILIIITQINLLYLEKMTLQAYKLVGIY